MRSLERALVPLEERSLLSAAIPTWDSQSNLTGAEVQPADVPPDNGVALTNWLAGPAAVAAAEVAPRQLMIVDREVPDYQALINQLGGRAPDGQPIDVVVIGPGDGLRQITEALARFDPGELSAIHVISHASRRGLRLGGRWVGEAELAKDSALVATWRRVLAPGADLLFYGCDLAGTTRGQRLLSKFHNLTGADVAGSTDRTGASWLAGDWDLEFATGRIETSVPFSTTFERTWGHILSVGVDAFSSAPASNQTTVTIAHTTSGTNRLMLVSVAIDPHGTLVNSVTYGGIALTRFGAREQPASHSRIEFWALLAPPTGPNNVVVNLSDTAYNGAVIGVMTFTGVNQTTPLLNFNATADKSATASVTVASQTNDLVFGVVHSHSSSSADPGTGQTEYWDAVADKSDSSGTISSGAVSVTNTWAVKDDFWTAAVVSVQADTNNLRAASLTPLQDAYIQSGSPTTNNGSTGSMIVDRETNAPQRSLVQFDLSSIPVGATIVSATLNLEALQIGGDLNIDIYRLLQAWTEGSVTWNESSTGTNWSTAGGNYDPTLVDTLFTNNTGQHSFDLTALVQSWINGTSQNNGVMISSFDGGGNRTVTYYTREGAVPPQLQITYATNLAPTLDTSKSPALAAVVEDAAAPSGAVGTPVSQLVDFAVPAGQVDNVTDPDLGALLGIAVTAADATNGTWWYSTNNGSTWLALGAISDTAARLLAADSNTRLYFQPNANFNGTSTITFRAWDQTIGTNGAIADTSVNGGYTAFSAATDTAAVTITPVNDAPVLTGANNFTTITEDQTTNSGNLVSSLIAGQINDPDSSPQSGIAVTALNSSTGTWQYSLNDGSTWSPVGTVTGTSALLLRSTDLLRFVPDGLNGTTASLTFRAWDQTGGTFGTKVNVSTNGGTTAFSTASATSSITVTSVNDAPVITSAATATVVENSTAVMTVTAADPDLPAPSLTYSISGGADAARFTIDKVTGVLRFLTAPNFESPTDAGGNNVYDVVVSASDGIATDTQAVAVTISDLRVSVDNQTTGSTTGTSLSLSHTTAGTNRLMIVSVSIGNPNGHSVGSVTYNGTALTFLGADDYGSDEDEARIELWALTAPAIGTHNVNVTMTGSTDGVVVGVVTFDGVDQADPLGAFASSSNDSSNPAVTVASGVDELVFSAITIESNPNDYDLVPGSGQAKRWDLYNGTANSGASTAPGASSVNMTWSFGDSNQWALAAVSIHPVVATNNLPTITSNGGGDSAAINLAENKLTVTTVTATDLDAQPLSYSISGGDDAARFAINSKTGVLSFVAAPNFESPADADLDNIYEVIVLVSDGAGGSDVQAINVTITDANEFAVSAVTDTDATANAVDENAANGTTVGVTAFASDADGTNNTITYSLTNSAGGRFAINSATGVVTVANGTLLDREAAASHTITVRATSSDGSSSTQNFTINLNDLDESDVGAIGDANAAADAVNENAANGTAVGVTASASDPDATNNTITFSLDDTAGGRFAINAATGVVTVADGSLLDREAAPSHTITVRATSSDGSSSTRSFTIAINDVDEFDVGAISDTDATTDAVNENAANGTIVGVTAFASDADATNNTITYSLTNNAGGRFAINASTGVVTVANGTLLDREAAASHTITVRAASSDGSFSTQNFTINLNDLDEFDVVAVNDTNAAANAVNENAANGTLVGITAFATDADATNNTITYSLTNDAGGRFAINSATGVVTVADGTLLDREAAASHTITVLATSSDGSSKAQNFTINLNDLDEFDVGSINDTNAAVDAVNENAANGAVVGVTAFASDADATTNTITYTLDDTAGGRFAINAVTGVVTVANGTLLDREAAASHTITVRATSGDGSFSTQSFTITVIDVDEFDVGPVSDTDSTTNAVDENAANGTTVGVTAFAADADATNNAITYSLTNDAGGRFAIDSVTGIVTVANGTLLDREAAAAHTITVLAASSDGSSKTQNYTINLNDLDEFDVGAVGDTNAAADAVNENAANGTVVGVTAFATDLDATNNTITYTLDDTASGRFAINAASGVVTVADGTLLDREAAASHTITVRATSSDGSFSTQSFTINLIDVDEFDVGLVSDTDPTTDAVDENAANGTVVGVIAFASDADVTNNAITYSLTNNAGGRFAVDPITGVVTVANGTLLDRESASSHTITVRATSSDGSVSTQAFTINVNDVDEFDVSPITDTDATVDAVNENDANGTVVGVTAFATDPDATNSTITYSLDDTAGGRFAIDPVTGVVTVADGTLLDREASAAHTVSVRATSDDGSFSTQSFTIALNDVNEFSVTPISDTDTTVDAVDENALNGTPVGVAAFASDADATTNTVTYALDDNAGGRFAIDAVTGVVTVADGTLLDYESATSHTITVRATSADGSFATQDFVVAINPLNDNTPVITSSAAFNLPENTTAVGTVSATDADLPAQPLTYTIIGGADASLFAIDPDTGALSFISAPDYELPADADGDNVYDVIVQASDGSLTDMQAIAVTVTPVNDNTPVITSDGGGATAAISIPENTTAITTVAATDADLPAQPLTYSIIGGADAALFVIDPTTGALTFGTAPDYELPADADGDNIYDVLVQASDGTFSATQTITVTVTPVNDNVPVITSNGGGATANVNVAENVSFVATVMATDADLPSQPLTYSIIGGTDAAAFGIDPTTGALTFVTAPDYEVPGDTDGDNVYDMIVQASDGTFTVTQAITVTVTPANDNIPVAGGESFGMLEDTSLTVGASGVLGNDTDDDADREPLTAILQTGPAHGSVTFNADGSFTYQPNPDFFGTDSFTYRANDGLHDSNVAIVTVFVTNVNDAPVLDGANEFSTIPGDPAKFEGDLITALLAGRFVDADGTPAGIALTGVSNNVGTWQYSLDGGATWIDVGDVNDTSALLLGPGDRLRFVNELLDDSPSSATFRAWDLTAGEAGTKADATVAGGTAAFSTQSTTVSGPRINFLLLVQPPVGSGPIIGSTDSLAAIGAGVDRSDDGKGSKKKQSEAEAIALGSEEATEAKEVEAPKVAEAAPKETAPANVMPPVAAAPPAKPAPPPVVIAEPPPAAVAILPALASPVTVEILRRVFDGQKEGEESPWTDPKSPIVVASAGGVAVVSVGTILLHTRVWSMLLSFASSLPMWKEFDPLAVLDAWDADERKRRKRLRQMIEEEEEMLAPIID